MYFLQYVMQWHGSFVLFESVARLPLQACIGVTIPIVSLIIYILPVYTCTAMLLMHY